MPLAALLPLGIIIGALTVAGAGLDGVHRLLTGEVRQPPDREGGGGETAGQPPVTPAARPSPPASTRARFRPSLPLACAAQEVADRQVEGGDVRARQDDKILL